MPPLMTADEQDAAELRIKKLLILYKADEISMAQVIDRIFDTFLKPL